MIVSDTGPIRYLVLLGYQDILPNLFGTAVVPVEVAAELSRDESPNTVRSWIVSPPAWLKILGVPDGISGERHAGERAAIRMAEQYEEPLLIDDWQGRQSASRSGVKTIGTLSVLLLADRSNLLDFTVAYERLLASNFYISTRLQNHFRQFLSRPV